MKKLLTHIRNFFKALFSAKGDVGSKRVTGIWLVLLFTAEVIVHLVSKVNVQSEILYVTATLIAACYGFNTLIAKWDIQSRSQVASDIATHNTEEPASSVAQEIVTEQPKTEEAQG